MTNHFVMILIRALILALLGSSAPAGAQPTRGDEIPILVLRTQFFRLRARNDAEAARDQRRLDDAIRTFNREARNMLSNDPTLLVSSARVLREGVCPAAGPRRKLDPLLDFKFHQHNLRRQMARKLQELPAKVELPSLPPIPEVISEIITCEGCDDEEMIEPTIAELERRNPGATYLVGQLAGDRRFSDEDDTIVGSFEENGANYTFIDFESRYFNAASVTVENLRSLIQVAIARIDTGRVYLAQTLAELNVEIEMCACKAGTNATLTRSGITVEDMRFMLPPEFEMVMGFLYTTRDFIALTENLLEEEFEHIRELTALYDEALQNAIDMTEVIEAGALSDTDANGCPIPAFV